MFISTAREKKNGTVAEALADNKWINDIDYELTVDLIVEYVVMSGLKQTCQHAKHIRHNRMGGHGRWTLFGKISILCAI